MIICRSEDFFAEASSQSVRAVWTCASLNMMSQARSMRKSRASYTYEEFLVRVALYAEVPGSPIGVAEVFPRLAQRRRERRPSTSRASRLLSTRSSVVSLLYNLA